MDIEKPPDDAAEQDRELVETDEPGPPQRGELPLDANEADAAEQDRELVETDEPGPPQHGELPLDANEADVVEQEITVGNDDDDYR